MKAISPAEQLWLRQVLSNSIFQENLYNRIKESRDASYRGVIEARGAEDLFRGQGKLMVWDKILTILDELRGEI